MTNEGAHMNRRELLAAAALAAGAPGPTHTAQRSAYRQAAVDYDVAVVGGGFAGVTAARDLSEAGLSVVLLEATARLGGRTFSIEDVEGYRVELGGTWVHWMQPHVWLEIERYGLHLHETPGSLPERSIFLDGETRHESAPSSGGAGGGSGARRYFEESSDLWERPFDGKHGWKALKRRDSMSALDRLDELDLPGPGGLFLESIIEVMGHCPADRVGFVEMSRWHALSGYSAAMIGDTTARYKLEEGTAELIRRMAEDGRAEVRFDTVVRRVDQERNVVRLHTAAGQEVAVRAAVVALPLNVLKDIEFSTPISKHKTEASKETHAGAGFKALFVVEGRLGNLLGMTTSRVNPFSMVTTYGSKDNTTLMVGFGVDGAGFDVNDRSAVEPAFRAFEPDARVVSSFGHKWLQDPFAQGTWCNFRPGQLTRHWPGLRESEGRLVFAGSDFSDGWRGFIDGAIADGAKAAREVQDLLS